MFLGEERQQRKAVTSRQDLNHRKISKGVTEVKKRKNRNTASGEETTLGCTGKSEAARLFKCKVRNSVKIVLTEATFLATQNPRKSLERQLTGERLVTFQSLNLKSLEAVRGKHAQKKKTREKRGRMENIWGE